jgi:uncharacterized protein YjbI with pentapeptide repeats
MQRGARIAFAGLMPLSPEYVTIFTAIEKKEELRGQVFRGGRFDGVDFSGADLSFARFQDVTLIACNFARADLRGVSFVRCDVQRSAFERTQLGKNLFDAAVFTGCTGFSREQQQYIERHGGALVVEKRRT